MTYFEKFPQIDYRFPDLETKVTDIFRYSQPIKEDLDSVLAFKQYQIVDGERPDIVSLKLYNTPDFFWTFFIINDNLREGWHNWPLSFLEKEDYIERYMNFTIVNTRPGYTLDTDGLIQSSRNNLALSMNVGQHVKGLISKATGIVRGIITENQQLVIELTGDTDFVANELIIEESSGDFIESYEKYEMRSAPAYYVDSEGRKQSNQLFFPTGVSDSELEKITFEDLLDNDIERRSSIKVIHPDYIMEFVDKFEESIVK